eukprot:232843_1
MSRKQIDIGLSKYYKDKEIEYFDNDGIGKFMEWCDVNGYDTEAIEDELEQEPIDCALVEFDQNFPTTKINDNKTNEIFNIIKNIFQSQLEYIVNMERKLLRFVAVEGYLRQINAFVPLEIANLVFIYATANVWKFIVPIEIMRKKDERNIKDIEICLIKNNIPKEAIDRFILFCTTEKYKFVDFETNLIQVRDKLRNIQ